MQIHQIVHNPTLQIILNSIDDHALAHIHDLQVCHIILLRINGLINLLVIANAVPEILRSFLGVLPNVVGGCSLDLEDIGHDELLVVAFALHKQGFDSFFVAAFFDPSSAGFGRVRGVKDGNDAAGLEPGQHVDDGCFCGCATRFFALYVVDVEEVRGRVWVVISAVVAYVEDARVD